MITINENKTITIMQGVGEDAMVMTVQVTHDEIDEMEKIRRFSHSSWEGKDLELLQEARNNLKERVFETPVPQQDVCEKTTNESKSNNGLWWILGVLGGLFISYLIVNAVLQKKVDEAKYYAVRSRMSNTIKAFNNKDLTFDYPGNWSFTVMNITDVMYLVDGQNEKGSEYGVFVIANQDNTLASFIDNVIRGYATTDGFKNVNYSAIYDTMYNGINAIAADYSYISNGNHYYAKVIGFVIKGYTIFINPVAHTEQELSGDDFKLMENTLKINN